MLLVSVCGVIAFPESVTLSSAAVLAAITEAVVTTADAVHRITHAHTQRLIKKVKESIAVNGTTSHSYRVSLAVWVTQCYLPPDTSEHTPPSPQPDRLVLGLPTMQGWRAE